MRLSSLASHPPTETIITFTQSVAACAGVNADYDTAESLADAARGDAETLYVMGLGPPPQPPRAPAAVAAAAAAAAAAAEEKSPSPRWEDPREADFV